MTAQTMTREEFREDFRRFREELHRELQHYATKEDLAKLETNLTQLETRLTRWMVGIMLSSAGVASTLTYAVVRLAS